MHDVGVVLAGEDVTRAAHVGGQLVNFVEAAIDRRLAELHLSQIANDEVVGLGFAEAWVFQVDATYPNAYPLQPLDEVAADEASRTTY
jgi:hypothetical protein